MSKNWLKSAMECAGFYWTEEFGHNIEVFVDALIEANRTTNLTSLKEKSEIYRNLVFDSLMVWKAVPMDSSLSILDFGTGAGFPGVPMKLYFPEARIIFLDSNGKKINFLKKNAYFFGDEEIFIKGRIDKQNKIPEFFKNYDIIIAKAVGLVSTLGPNLWPYLKNCGKLLFFMGPRKEKEETLRKNGKTIGSIEEYTVPEISYKRRIYILTKENLIECFT